MAFHIRDSKIIRNGILSGNIVAHFHEDKVHEYGRPSWYELMEHLLINANVEKAFELRYNTVKTNINDMLESLFIELRSCNCQHNLNATSFQRQLFLAKPMPSY